MKRFIIELGTGADMHGGDVNKAAKRAIKDAMSHCCLSGVVEILDVKDFGKVHTKIKIGCPYPEKINQEELLGILPAGSSSIEEVVVGGLATKGLHVSSFGEGDEIVVVTVSLTVFIDQ